jgi:phenolic acid decarboxylase
VLLIWLSHLLYCFVYVLNALNPFLQVAEHHETGSDVDHALALYLANDLLHRVVVLPDWINDEVYQVLKDTSVKIVVLQNTDDRRSLVFVCTLFVDVA